MKSGTFYPIFSGDGYFDVDMESAVSSASEYPGPYEVTPGETAQTLDTAGQIMGRDVVVAAIPSNYGRIAWNGANLIVF